MTNSQGNTGNMSGPNSLDSSSTYDYAKEKVNNMASEVSAKVHKYASVAEEKTDDAIATVGEKLTNFAGTIREKGPSEGSIGSAVSAVAESIKSGGQYLTQHGVGDIADDATALVKRYPVQSLWVGIGLGVLIGSAFSKKN